MIVPPWAKTAALLVILASLFQAGRVHERRIWERDTAKQEARQTKADAVRTVAGAQFDARMARAGTDTVQNYVERLAQDLPVVVRTVERIRNICVRDKPVPRARDQQRESPRPLQAAGGGSTHRGDTARAGSDRRRSELVARREKLSAEFAGAIPADIETCKTELTRLDEAARYLRMQDGEE